MADKSDRVTRHYQILPAFGGWQVLMSSPASETSVKECLPVSVLVIPMSIYNDWVLYQSQDRFKPEHAMINLLPGVVIATPIELATYNWRIKV